MLDFERCDRCSLGYVAFWCQKLFAVGGSVSEAGTGESLSMRKWTPC